MPEIETWSHLPAAVRAHLVERMYDRKITLQDLNQLRVGIESKPNVPEGPWYKDFWLVQAVRGGPIPENVSSVGASCYRTEPLVQFHLSALSG
jgi:hypothetical protein